MLDTLKEYIEYTNPYNRERFAIACHNWLRQLLMLLAKAQKHHRLCESINVQRPLLSLLVLAEKNGLINDPDDSEIEKLLKENTIHKREKFTLDKELAFVKVQYQSLKSEQEEQHVLYTECMTNHKICVEKKREVEKINGKLEFDLHNCEERNADLRRQLEACRKSKTDLEFMFYVVCSQYNILKKLLAPNQHEQAEIRYLQRQVDIQELQFMEYDRLAPPPTAPRSTEGDMDTTTEERADESPSSSTTGGKANLEKTAEEYEREIALLEHKIREYERAISDMENLVEADRALEIQTKEKLESLMLKHIECEQKVTEYSASIAKLKKELADCHKINEERKLVNDVITNKVQLDQEKYDKLHIRFTETLERNSVLEKENASVSREILSLEDTVKELQRKNDKCVSENSMLKKAVLAKDSDLLAVSKKLETALEDFSREKGLVDQLQQTVYQCEQNRTDENSVVIDLNRKVAELLETNSSITKQYKLENERLEKLYETCKKDLSSLQVNHSKCQTKKSELRYEIERMEKRLDPLEKELRLTKNQAHKHTASLKEVGSFLQSKFGVPESGDTVEMLGEVYRIFSEVNKLAEGTKKQIGEYNTELRKLREEVSLKAEHVADLESETTYLFDQLKNERELRKDDKRLLQEKDDSISELNSKLTGALQKPEIEYQEIHDFLKGELDKMTEEKQELQRGHDHEVSKINELNDSLANRVESLEQELALEKNRSLENSDHLTSGVKELQRLVEELRARLEGSERELKSERETNMTSLVELRDSHERELNRLNKEILEGKSRSQASVPIDQVESLNTELNYCNVLIKYVGKFVNLLRKTKTNVSLIEDLIRFYEEHKNNTLELNRYAYLQVDASEYESESFRDCAENKKSTEYLRLVEQDNELQKVLKIIGRLTPRVTDINTLHSELISLHAMLGNRGLQELINFMGQKNLSIASIQTEHQIVTAIKNLIPLEGQSLLLRAEQHVETLTNYGGDKFLDGLFYLHKIRAAGVLNDTLFHLFANLFGDENYQNRLRLDALLKILGELNSISLNETSSEVLKQKYYKSLSNQYQELKRKRPRKVPHKKPDRSSSTCDEESCADESMKE